MSRYAIVASEGIYQGLHGIVDYAIVDCDSEDEVAAIGKEMSLQVMDDWGWIQDELMAQISDSFDSTIDTEEELLEAIKEENVNYYYFKLCEEAEGQDSNLLNQELYDDEDKFRRTWAAEQIICKF